MTKIDSEYILNDNTILSMYNEIDKINNVPFSHGLKHIKNTLLLADKLAKVFNLSDREKEILKVCVGLHDVGQVFDREEHGAKSSQFAKKYLSQFNYFSKEEIDMICSAISTHSEKKNFDNLENDYSWFLLFIDKMDFTFNRLENNCLDEYGYLIYNDIKDIHFEIQNHIFNIRIELIDNPILANKKILFADQKFMKKIPIIIKKFCEHFRLNYFVYLDKEILNIERHLQ